MIGVRCGQIERRLNQPIVTCQIPTRAEVEAKRFKQLQVQLKETLSGERMASFLPLVSELGEEYDPQAIAAAALQLIYDQNCPNWMKGDWDLTPARRSTPKPILKGKKKYASLKP